MAIERTKVNIPDALTSRTLKASRPVAQSRSSDRRWPCLARRSAIPDRYKLFSVNGLAAKLALAPFSLGTLGRDPLTRYPALIEAHW
jgi:hypothetical protein